MSESANAATPHPLAPLTRAELELSVALIHAHGVLTDRILFESITLHEPAKALMRNFTPPAPVPRQALAVVLDRNAQQTWEFLVSLDERRILRAEAIAGVQPWIMAEEIEEASELAIRHPEFLAGLRRRGISDARNVTFDILAAGNFGAAEENERRLLRLHAFFVDQPGDNTHVRPIEGLVPVVDLNTLEVLRVEDFGVVPVPPERGNLKPDGGAGSRGPLAPLEITQPQGPGFAVDGYAVSWQNWSFRIGFTQREGLVLHTLSFDDGNAVRPVCYRASLSELVVPYAETRNDYYRNHSFDAGEAGLGNAVNALQLGCDCLGEIHYFDVDMVNGRGEVVHRPNAICMHEEDYGVLWKHTHKTSLTTDLRRSRRLVVSSFFTVGNYDYGVFWYLYLDGTIEFEAKLTGVLYCGALEPGEQPPYGRLVAPQVNGMIHEHYFTVRLDMSVDGDCNSVLEVEAELVPTGEDNPHGNAHGARESLIADESMAARDNNPALGRFWKVVNRDQRNALGGATGYRLSGASNVKPMHQPGSPFLRRAPFVEHDLWVSAHDPAELYAPGRYVNQNADGPNLAHWVRAGRNLTDADVVLWYTCGIFHVPRPEDFPVMPVEYTGFTLKPDGFFDRNPTLDLTPPACRRPL